MINIEKGRYWDKPWSLVDGCTPCSPGCDHCWSAGMTHRFESGWIMGENGDGDMPLLFTDAMAHFNGNVRVRPDRLSIPLKRRKPTVYAIWNDLFHEDVPHNFINDVFLQMFICNWHAYIILTKRPRRMVEWFIHSVGKHNHIYKGLTVCNQQEANEKIPVFLQVPGKKFLSIEPMLGPIDLTRGGLWLVCPECGSWEIYGPRGDTPYCDDCGATTENPKVGIDAVILGGETGPGARPMHPDWVRSVRDQCATAGVPFFFKSWGQKFPGEGVFPLNYERLSGPELAGFMRAMGMSNRYLDGRTHDDLPWRTSHGN